MRYRANLVLMEMLIALTFFAVSAVICAGVLAQSYTIIHESQNKTRAMYIAQNWAERIAGSDDPLAMLKSAASAEENVYTIDEGEFSVTAAVDSAATGAGVLLSVDLTVSKGAEALVRLPAGRYIPGEGAP
jgi:Tfp pilus assembly protein PilV